MVKAASLSRIPKAAGYALQGLKALYQREAAFRQQVWLMVLSLPVAWYVSGIPLWAKALVTLCSGLCLIVEAINSALEALIDYLAPDHHKEAGFVKDVGSAAVMMALIIWSHKFYRYCSGVMFSIL